MEALDRASELSNSSEKHAVLTHIWNRISNDAMYGAEKVLKMHLPAMSAPSGAPSEQPD